jgi:LmbE family N-acetylglucosaminyl deacetylase
MTASVVKSGRRVMAVVAHADDEVLGCGGTLRRHVLAGDEVWTIILADGETSRGKVSADAAIAGREGAAKDAAAILGVQNVVLHRLPDNRLDTCALLDIVKLVEQYIEAAGPDTIYTHHAGDVNIDHRRVHEAVVTACRPQAGHPVQTLLFFETASSTEWQVPNSAPAFQPNWFVDISGQLNIKLKALEPYAGEMRSWPHPRSIEGIVHLARWRGATVGCEAAEAFILGRQVRRQAVNIK